MRSSPNGMAPTFQVGINCEFNSRTPLHRSSRLAAQDVSLSRRKSRVRISLGSPFLLIKGELIYGELRGSTSNLASRKLIQMGPNTYVDGFRKTLKTFVI